MAVEAVSKFQSPSTNRYQNDPRRYEERTHGEPTSLAGKSFLVIEDAPDTRMLIRHYLTRAGSKVDFAENGLEGYRKALAGSYDVIVMDLQMPVMDGYEAIQILRKWGVHTPVIAWTAHALKEDRDRCMALGFTDYVAKPVDPERLLEKLRQHSE